MYSQTDLLSLMIYFFRLKISNQQNHCPSNDHQRYLNWATKTPIMCDRGECLYFKQSISLTNINRIQMNGPLKKSPRRIKLSRMLQVNIKQHFWRSSFQSNHEFKQRSLMSFYFQFQRTLWIFIVCSMFICQRIWIDKKWIKLDQIWNCLVHRVIRIEMLSTFCKFRYWKYSSHFAY